MNQNKNSNFAEKSDYIIKLNRFTHDVNRQSDGLRKAYIEQVHQKQDDDVPAEDKPKKPADSNVANIYAF